MSAGHSLIIPAGRRKQACGSRFDGLCPPRHIPAIDLEACCRKLATMFRKLKCREMPVRFATLLRLAAATAVMAGHSTNVAAPPPASVDLRPAFTNWGLPLRLQGNRGTCSVFTLVGALEYALAIQQKRGTPLSVEFLNWASNDATRNTADGGFFSDLWSGFVAHGICAEAALPYRRKYDAGLRPDPATVEKARGLAKSGLRLHWIKPWDVKTGLTDSQFLQIKGTIAKQWPVCGGFRWPKEERWRDGVLEMRPPAGVFDGHSVLLVGYRDDLQQPGGGVFLIRNSGKGGHDAAMSYEYVRAYMNDAAWVEIPAKAETTLSKESAAR